jgi:2-polyprenyl-3-methyl-5-hydroxy-6-metoxy-1,4-benzoquinol methylase
MYSFNSDICATVDDAIQAIGSFDLIFENGSRKNAGPSPYLAAHRHEYVRTVQDVAEHFAGQSDCSVLEIGAFFGVVSVSLAKLGFRVTASDIPEYMNLAEQQERYRLLNVEVVGIRLEDFQLPFDDNRFDAVVMCEVLEHLNFNPLPLIKEINRVCAPSGLFYLSLPNQASIYNRLSLLRGKSIQVSVDDFFDQLTSHAIVNGHWREYTADDIGTMLTRLGFEMHKHYYFSYGECLPKSSLRAILARAFYEVFPQFKENQTALAIKKERSRLIFSIPRTVHPTLRKI